MTIEQLKAHMDRRFDRLERTKADRGELRRHVATANRRWAQTRRAFRTFATKEDLKRFATKEDLKRFATKEDLKRFATKEDLKRFATKEDLERFATKEDLERFATKEDLKRFATKGDFARLEDRVVSVQRMLQGIVAHHSRVLDEHEARISDLEGRG